MATITELTKKINANTVRKDKAVAVFRVEQKKLTTELDVLVAAEAAAAIVAEMSDGERQAMLVELGGS